jgi:hypothetical protein
VQRVQNTPGRRTPRRFDTPFWGTDAGSEVITAE